MQSFAACQSTDAPPAELATPNAATTDMSTLPAVDQQGGAVASAAGQDAAALAAMVQQQQQAAWAHWCGMMASMAAPHITASAAAQAQLMLQMQAAQAQAQAQAPPSLPLGTGLPQSQAIAAVDVAKLAAVFPSMWPNPFLAPGLVSAINSRNLPGLPPWPSCVPSAPMGSAIPSTSDVLQ